MKKKYLVPQSHCAEFKTEGHILTTSTKQVSIDNSKENAVDPNESLTNRHNNNHPIWD